MIRDKSCADAILALKCYWTLERRCDRSPKNVAGFADELYRMIMEQKGATLNNIVGHAFTLGGYSLPQLHQQVMPHRPIAVPTFQVIRPPPLIPSMSATHYSSPAATPSPPRSMMSSLSEFTLSGPPLLPPLHAASAASCSATLPPFNHDIPHLAPLKRHTHPEIFPPQLPPLKRLKSPNSPPSPPPNHFALPAPPACSPFPSSVPTLSAPTAGPVHEEENTNTRLRVAAAEVLAALLPRPSASGITA